MLLYAGDQDFICNYMGIENLIKEMEWSGEKGLGVSANVLSTNFMYLSYVKDRRNKDLVCQQRTSWYLGRIKRSELCKDLQFFTYGPVRFAARRT